MFTQFQKNILIKPIFIFFHVLVIFDIKMVNLEIILQLMDLCYGQKPI